MSNIENHTPLHLRIDGVAVEGPNVLKVVFGDGRSYLVDFKEAIGKNPILRPVLSRELFSQAEIVELGRMLRWPGSEDLEVSSDQVLAWGVDQAGGFSHTRFIEWMWNNELTLSSAAVALGLSRRMVAYYRDGSKEIPRTVALACKGWEALQAA